MLTTVNLVLRHYQSNAALEQSTRAITDFLGPSRFLSLSDACELGSIALLECIWTASCTREDERTPEWSLRNYLRSEQHYHKWQFAKSLEAAASRGDLAMVEWILVHFPGCEAPATVANGAEKNGYLRVLRCLSAHTSPSRCPLGDAIVKSEVLVSAGGSTNFSRTAVAKATENGELVKYLNERLYLDDCARDIAVKHALSIGDFLLATRLLPAGKCLLDYAGGCPRVEMIELMLDCGYLRRSEALAVSTLPHLARGGHLDLAQQVVSLHSPFPTESRHWTYTWVTAISEAGTSGNKPTLQWLVEHPMGKEAIEQLSKATTVSNLFYLAARRGHVESMDYLHKQRIPCNFDSAMDAALDGGHAGVVKWLLSNHVYTDGSISRFRAIYRSAEQGHLEIIKLFHELSSSASYDTEGSKRRRVCPKDLWWSFATDPLYFAAKGGHVHVLEWFQANREQSCGPDTMDVAAEHGHLEVVKWLHLNRTEGCTTQAMTGAAAGGHMDVLQWLHLNRSEGCGSRAMYEAAEFGQLEAVKWLYENYPGSRTNTAIDRAIRSGHLQVAWWLHQRSPDYKVGDELEGHKELVTVNGVWGSASAFEVLLYLHARCGYVFTSQFLLRIRASLYRNRRQNPRLLGHLERWLEENYPQT